jgi:hypothetical protein
MIDNRKRLVGAFLSLGVALSICAFAARAPGRGLSTRLTNSANVSGSWSPCNGLPPTLIWAQGIGFDSNLAVACSANDSQGTTVHRDCPNGVMHIARLVASACFPIGGCPDPLGGQAALQFCTTSGVAWSNGARCSATMSATHDGTTCQQVTFTSGSIGTDP